jgi:hypothetical protein
VAAAEVSWPACYSVTYWEAADADAAIGAAEALAAVVAEAGASVVSAEGIRAEAGLPEVGNGINGRQTSRVSGSP